MDNPPKLRWRSATDADHEFLRHLMRVTVKDYLLRNSETTEEACETQFAQMCALPWQIVSCEGKDVGAMSFHREFHYGHLLAFHVLPEFQNRGIGSEMLRTLLEWTAERRLTVYLEVMPINEGAKRLYERFGFVEVGYAKSGNSYRMELAPPQRPPLFPSLDFSFLKRFWKRGEK